MEFTIPSRLSIGTILAFTWAGFTVLWQLAIYVTQGPEGQHLGRMIYFSVKPLVFAALMAQGISWPRILVGVLGTFEGLAYVLIGFLFAAEPAGVVITGGALVYSALCLLILYSRRLDNASCHGARMQGCGPVRRVARDRIRPRR